MSVEFDGSNDYITYSGMPHNALPIVMECWFKFDGWGGAGITYQRLIDASGAASHAILQIERDGTGVPVTYKLQFSAYTIFGGTSTATCATTLSTGTWYHGLGYWRQSSPYSIGCLVDGANLAGNTRAGTVLAFTTHTIGASSAGAEKYDGKLAEVAVWNYSVTSGIGTKPIYAGASGLLPIYRNPFTHATTPRLMSWLRLLSASDIDLIQNGFTLTWNGPPTESEDHPPVYGGMDPISWPRGQPATLAAFQRRGVALTPTMIV
jgi:hypothetical protein